MDISWEIIGMADISNMLAGLPAAVRVVAIRAITRETYRFMARVQDQLNGPVLNVRTGRLRNSIAKNTKIIEDGDIIYGQVGTNVTYGRFHEFGGNFDVREHMRMQKIAFGRPMANPRQVLVRAHKMRLPARSFLRATFKAMEAEMVSNIKNAIEKGA